jgi:1,2-diacylglycerol 3-alpha-glucosyltransferase
MRIGMMADLYTPYVSGVTVMISLLKRRLETLGQQVFLFTFGAMENRDQEPNIIRSPGLPIGHEGLTVGFGFSRRALETLATMDVVHVHHPLLSGRVALRYCRPRGIPIVFSNHTRHDLYARMYAQPLPAWLVDWWYSGYLRRFYSACNLVIAPSAAAMHLVERLSPTCQRQMIPNGIDLKPFLEVRSSIRREELGFGTEHVVMVYVGRLAREKNVHFLIEAFAHASRRERSVRLLIVGSGPLRASLEASLARMGISGNVRFAGFVPHGEVPSYLACADAFVTASVTEVQALTVIEAMACGLPVVGIDAPGVGDAVADGVTGLLSPHDPQLFGETMLRLMDDGQRRLLGEQARKASLAFAIDSTADEVLRCYRRLLAAPAESPRTSEPGTSLPSRAARGTLARGGDSAFRRRLR